MAEIPTTYPTARLPLTQDKLYRKEYQARALRDIVSPLLIFDPMFPSININTRAIVLQKQSYSSGTRYSDASDPRKQHAPGFEHGGKIPMVTVSEWEYEAHTLGRHSMGFEIGLDARQETANIDAVSRARNRVAYWLAEQINAGIVTDVLNDFGVVNVDDTGMADMMEHIATDIGYETTIGHITGVLDTTYHWDAADADPVVDILDAKTVFNNQSGYWFKLTDFLMTERALNLFNKFIINHGGSWAKDPTGSGWVTNAVGGITFHSLKNDVAGWNQTTGDDYIWGIDRNNPAATTYKMVDVPFPAANGMNYHSWFDDETKVQKYQYWFTRRSVVREPRAMIVLKVRD